PNPKKMSKQNNHTGKKGRSYTNDLLLYLIEILHQIFPKEETINPFYKVVLDKYPSEYQYYYKLLTHYITLINQKHRTMEKQKFVTSREDIVSSLNLLEIMVLQSYRSEEQTAKEIYQILKNNTKEDQILTAKNISQIIHYKKTQTARIIKILLKMDKIILVSTHKKIGYLYQLK
ncbi:hypothetical protein, partial [Flavobacterium columnare]